jgi:hypothetical protein
MPPATYIDEKLKKHDEDTDLWGRRYHFTEYYDSASGLITRFQQTTLANGKEHFATVDEFRDSGYSFLSDREVEWHNRRNRDRKSEEDATGKLAVEIEEDSIRNSIFDKNIGGPSIPGRDDYLYGFPIYEVFNFLLALGRRFHETEGNAIIKWPNQIEEKLKRAGIKYETFGIMTPKYST